jgi:hypothetical protein
MSSTCGFKWMLSTETERISRGYLKLATLTGNMLIEWIYMYLFSDKPRYGNSALVNSPLMREHLIWGISISTTPQNDPGNQLNSTKSNPGESPTVV